jgi:hypothetical protein
MAMPVISVSRSAPADRASSRALLMWFSVVSRSGSLSGDVAFGPDLSCVKSEVITVHQLL